MRPSVPLFVLLAIGLGANWQSEPPDKTSDVSRPRREHAALFNQYRAGERLSRRAQREGRFEVTAGQFPGTPGALSSAPPLPADYRFRQALLEADAILAGKVLTRSSALTENEEFIYSDYSVLVQLVLRNDPTAPIKSGSTITVTRPGGELQLNGHTVRAIDGFFKPFILGQSYILIVRRIPVTGAYLATPEGSYQLVDQRAISLCAGARSTGVLRVANTEDLTPQR